MHIQIIMQTRHPLPGEPSTYPQTRKSNLETSQKMICFKKIEKILIHFCMNQWEDVPWNFFGNRTRSQIGWPCKKIDWIWSSSVRYVNSLLMVILFLHIKIMWMVKVERSVKRPCGFIILSSSNFSIPSTKKFETSILSMITILCLFVTSTTMRIRNIQTSMKTHLDLSICG